MKTELTNLIALVEEIESTLFHHNHAIDGWHLSGETEPIMNFVANFNMEALTEAKALLQALTSVKSESAEEWWEQNKKEAMDFIGSCEVITKEQFIQAMHSFANEDKKHHAIEFLEWYSKNGYYQIQSSLLHTKKGEKGVYTESELYKEFLN